MLPRLGRAWIGTALAGIIAASAIYATEAGAQTQWHLSADPTTLVIGSVDGPAEELFHEIRGVMSTPDGMIVVANGGPPELRVFSDRGRFLRSFGGEGDGPGEFRRIGWIDTCGGPAIVAYDRGRHRITKWDTDGSLLDEFTIQGPRGDLPPYSVACGPSGTFVVIGWSSASAMAREPGPYRPIVPIGIVDERGRRERWIDAYIAPAPAEQQPELRRSLRESEWIPDAGTR